MANKLDKRAMWRRVFRPRILVYSGILMLIVLITSVTLALRLPLKVDVIRDRGIPRMVEDGSVDNVYRLQIMNTEEKPHRYTIALKGLPGAVIVSGADAEVPSATTKAIAVRVRVPPGQASIGSNRISFVVTDRENPNVTVTEKAAFLMPR